MLTFRGVRQVGKWLISSSHLDEGLFFFARKFPQKETCLGWRTVSFREGSLGIPSQIAWVSFFGGQGFVGFTFAHGISLSIWGALQRTKALYKNRFFH